MLTERCLQSEALGRQARDFVAWSASAGNVLSRISNKFPSRGRDIVTASPEFQAFPLERIKVLHPHDGIHYPAVHFARTRGAETIIQSFNLITAAKQRYAHIMQSEPSGMAIGAAITRMLPLEPSGVSISFGRKRDFPNYASISGVSCVRVDLTGEVYAITPKRWSKQTTIDWVSDVLYHLTHGINMSRMQNVRTLSELGYMRDINPGPHVGAGM